MKIKLVVRDGIIAIKFDEKSFFSTILGFNHGWDYQSYNEYISQKFLNLSTTNKIDLKADGVDAIVVHGKREPIRFSFELDKLPGYKIFSEPETNHYTKVNNSVLNTISIHLEDDNNEEMDFNQETITFTLQMIKT